MESCGMSCLKYFMFFFNFLFFLAGGGMVGISVWVLVDGSTFFALVGDVPNLSVAIYLVLAVGCALVVISFFGCCGAIKENKCMLGTFFTLVLIIFIIQIVGGILAVVFEARLETEVVATMNQYDETNDDNGFTKGWNVMQTTVKCCGYKNYSDWQSANWTKREETSLIPPSCCIPQANTTQCVLATDPTLFYSTGCEQTIRQYYWIIGGVALGVLVVELLALIFTCCLYRSIDL